VIVYIWGNLTADNFTPRPGRDTVGQPGQLPGLSAWDSILPGKKAQGIDTEKIKPPLKAIADNVEQGGEAGHFAIVPIDQDGEVDADLLEAWSKLRETGHMHELTQILLDAVVEPNVKGQVP
jgi:hypothetical protein